MDTTACVAKVKGKFDGGADPAKGCFAKLESKTGSDCITTGDTTAAETAVDDRGTAIGAAIEPTNGQAKGDGGTEKLVGDYLGAIRKWQSTAQTPGKATDTSACVAKAKGKYDGGDVPSKGCFAKLEAKTPNDCSVTNNSDDVRGLADTCAANFATLLTSPT